MKKFIYAVLLICGTALVSFAVVAPIVPGTRVGQGFNVHYDGSVLIYEGKIDGEYDEDIILLYQTDLSKGYKIVRWSDYKEHGNISATLECVDGSRVVVRFRYLNTDRTSRNRTYYWDIPLDHTNESGNIERAYLAIRTEQHQNFGRGCSAGFFAPFALLLAAPLILRRSLKK